MVFIVSHQDMRGPIHFVVPRSIDTRKYRKRGALFRRRRDTVGE